MDITPSRTKRSRSSSSSSAGSIGSSPSSDEWDAPPPKYHRGRSTSPSSSTLTIKPFLCVLPPTCSQPGTSTSYATQIELDRHQDTFHKWICHIPIRDRGLSTPSKGKGKENGSGVPESFSGDKEEGRRMKECLKVFPDERLLNLHYTEVHDPISKEKKEKGQKIFECFLDISQCGRKFLNPKKRRRHMIDKHKYPPDYFFSITNHGINAIAQEDGLAMSLIRPRRDPPLSVSYPEKMESTRSYPEDNHDKPATSVVSNSNGKENSPRDVDMDDLMGKLESSLTFVPRGVRKATKAKEKIMQVDTHG
ncbi:uncharacterized protein I303_100452 [Kwoniella dejecticola CBS 10117]|uniref:C2H2-type domain-containing protein n=1 Tax=Kwoniella dejecticola CBS 10117 TaxID=1296121 RepID=A0A1A6AEY7_9TREE|nr:uncharacterized protein I303_00452 [Kwoniella dejecticola CBS 10117]OBR88635.1 hypothetical protein I303_00452 [Kwoniella dejecticola CBS 10117]